MTDIEDDRGFAADELLAAEYALGVLAGPERAGIARRIAREPSFAALVAEWEQRLAPWAGEIPEVAPPPRVWERIAAELPTRPQGASVWRSLVFWRGAALAGALAAACLAVVLYLGALAPQRPLIATIEGGGHGIFVATVNPQHASIAVVPAAYSPDATRVPELWLIPHGGKPLPLGVLRADRKVDLAIPAPILARVKSGAVLAVSLEPSGGSPTGQPTGPVIGSGALTNL